MSRALLMMGLGLLQLGCAATAETTTFKVYYLGGQSNMDGYGYVEELAEDQRFVSDDVMIFIGRTVFDDDPEGGTGSWDKLQPGFGTGYGKEENEGKYSDRFGPELTFGRSLAALSPNDNIAIIKYSLGGSGLKEGVGYGTWAIDYGDGEGINQYDNALKTFSNALSVADIDGDGKTDRLVPSGIIWMQGEADAYDSQEAADEYLENITRLMALLRDALGNENLPIVIGKITDSGMVEDGTVMDYIGTVQKAQQDFATNDACAAYVTITDDLTHSSDGWHYDTDGFVRLGEAFASATRKLQDSCGD